MTTMIAAVLAWELTAMVPDDVVKQFEERSFTYTGGEYKNEAFKYRLLKPEKIEAGKTYPVVLFLHGAGERGDDNTNQLQYLPEQMAKQEFRRKYPCFLVAPQCRAGKMWVQLNWSDKTSVPMKEPGDQMKVVLGILEDVLKNNPTDPDRVYLTGLSMGGYGSWDLAMRMPEKFAAAAPICGGGDETHADTLVKLPVWAWHGDADEAVPVERSRKMIDAIKRAGGNPKYTELKGVGHNSWTPAYSSPEGLIPWLFEQRRAKQATAANDKR